MVEERLAGLPVYDSTEVFASLEPPEATPAHRERVDSVLARWATDDSSRVWLLASGALCVFVGLLPPVSRRRGAGAAEDEVLAAADRLVEDDVDGEAGAEALEPGDEGDQREGDEPLGVVDEAAELDEDEVEDEVDGDDVDEEEPEEFEGDEGESDDEVSDGVESEAESEDNR
jgi:hypothetical protein